MSSIRREIPGKGISWSEIQLDGANSTAKGKFVAHVESSALREVPLIATVSRIGDIHLGIGIRTEGREVVVLLGDTRTAAQKLRKKYALPKFALDGHDGHELKVDFAERKILGVHWDGKALNETHDGRA